MLTNEDYENECEFIGSRYILKIIYKILNSNILVVMKLGNKILLNPGWTLGNRSNY